MTAQGGLAFDPEWAEYQRWRNEEVSYIVSHAGGSDPGTAGVAGEMAAYDRQHHLTWYEREYPDVPNWPPYPRDDAQAARFIADYSAGGAA